MAERKVFNKYIPPDFDPGVLPKGERPSNGQIKVRSMLPMTICCKTCGEYIARGTKFNSRQEIAQGLEYLGLKRWRFYMKCTGCSSEMTFLTDPENDHYVCEHNCTRTFEPWRAQQEAEELIKQAKTEEEKYDMMKAMQNRASEEKKRLDLMDTINDIQDINNKHAFVNQDEIIATLSKIRNANVDDESTIENELNNLKDSLLMEEFRAKKRIKLDPNIATVNLVNNTNDEVEPNDDQNPVNNIKTTDNNTNNGHLNYNDSLVDDERKKFKFDFSKKITNTNDNHNNNNNNDNDGHTKNGKDKNNDKNENIMIVTKKIQK